jgi:hypothetical protein
MQYPPDFENSRELRDKLESILAEDEDEEKAKGLQEFVEVGEASRSAKAPDRHPHSCAGEWSVGGTKSCHPSTVQVMVGGAWFKMMQKAEDEEFSCRAAVAKWIYEHDFVSDYKTLPQVQAVLDVKRRVEERQSKPDHIRYFF